jgi:hypothetical protein
MCSALAKHDVGTTLTLLLFSDQEGTGVLCCLGCFDDENVKAFVADRGKVGACDYCGASEVVTCDTGTVGEFIREGLRRAYVLAEEEAGPFDPDDQQYLWADPSDADMLWEVLQREAFSGLVSELDRSRDLAHDLMADSGSWDPKDSLLDDFRDVDSNYRLNNEVFGRQDSGFDDAWEAFCFTVTHIARFFEDRKSSLPRAKLLRSVMDLAHKLEYELPPETRLWRARCRPWSVRVPKTQTARERAVGPPPGRASKGNRMSPPGISFTYLGDSPATCATEIEARGGKAVWLGQFKTTRALRLLDLSGKTRVVRKSIFMKSYDHSDTWAHTILVDFAREIGRSIRGRDRELEYVPTQVLSEWLRLQGLAGVRYASSKRPGGLNYALFCGPRVREPILDSPFPSGLGGAWPPKGLPLFTSWLALEDFATMGAGRARATL